MNGKRVLVCGGRRYSNRDHIWDTLTGLDHERGPFAVIIHGGATGVDSEAMIWAQTMGRKHMPFEADWVRHGRQAGPRRNQRMIDEGRPDLVIAFPGGAGTSDTMKRARRSNIEVIEIRIPTIYSRIGKAPNAVLGELK